MPTPFPGMDPYLETNPLFQELHTQMLAAQRSKEVVAAFMGKD
jgi:hypothetical protein